MEKQASIFTWLLVAGLLSHNLIVIPVMASTTGLEDQKNYYSPDPHGSTPPSPSSLSASLCNSHGHSPSHGHTPSHGIYGGSPPSHSTPSPPSGGNCETPPVEPTPTPYTPTPSTPSNPPSGGGGYYPPTTPTPTTPTPSTPTPSTPTPTTPTPSTPTPTTPTPSAPSPPYTPDPNSPYSCNYWRTHPGLIWGLFGWWGTVGNAFGVTSLPGFGTSMSLQQALSNTRTDGYGSLYREGTASLLNSMITHKFPYTTRQVRESFVTALASNKAAAAQGQLFKQANEGKLKPRA